MRRICPLFILAVLLLACNPDLPNALPPPKQSSQPTAIEKLATPPLTHTPRPDIATLAAEMAQATIRAQGALIDCEGNPDRGMGYLAVPNSPSGAWRVAYCRYPNTGHTYTKVINTAGLVSWEVPFYETFGIKAKGPIFPDGITDGEMIFANWSNHEKYAFFRVYFCCLDGPGMIFVDGFELYRLELNTGNLIELIPGASAFAFSPDGDRLVIFNPETRRVIVRGVESEQEFSFAISDYFGQVGVFSWSPDGNMVVFSAGPENWEDSDVGFTIYMIDISKRTIKVLLSQPPHNYYAKRWLSDSEILFSEVNLATDPEEVVFDIEAKALMPLASATPDITPSP